MALGFLEELVKDWLQDIQFLVMFPLPSSGQIWLLLLLIRERMQTAADACWWWLDKRNKSSDAVRGEVLPGWVEEDRFSFKRLMLSFLSSWLFCFTSWANVCLFLARLFRSVPFWIHISHSHLPLLGLSWVMLICTPVQWHSLGNRDLFLAFVPHKWKRGPSSLGQQGEKAVVWEARKDELLCTIDCARLRGSNGPGFASFLSCGNVICGDEGAETREPGKGNNMGILLLKAMLWLTSGRHLLLLSRLKPNLLHLKATLNPTVFVYLEAVNSLHLRYFCLNPE